MHTNQAQKEDKFNKHSEELFRDYFTASEVSLSEDEPADQRLLSVMSIVSTERNREISRAPDFKKKPQDVVAAPKPPEKKRRWFRLGCLGLE